MHRGFNIVLYLDSVGLDQMHVECWSVRQNLPTSFHRAEDVGPHFFGELCYGGFNNLSVL